MITIWAFVRLTSRQVRKEIRESAQQQFQFVVTLIVVVDSQQYGDVLNLPFPAAGGEELLSFRRGAFSLKLRSRSVDFDFRKV